MFTIVDDIEFLHDLASDIVAKEGASPVALYIEKRLESLADKLDKLHNLDAAGLRRFADSVEARENPAGSPIPDDYHCGDQTCEACNTAAANLAANQSANVGTNEAVGLPPGPEVA